MELLRLYDREKAVEYAHKWAFDRNPAYSDFELLGGDCTNFASQCLYAGYGQMNYTPTLGWYYINLNNRAPAWTGVNEFYKFLTTNKGAGPRGIEVNINEVDIGDFVQIDFDGDGIYDHTPIIVDTGDYTISTVLVAAHSIDSDFRPLDTYDFENIRFIHIL